MVAEKFVPSERRVQLEAWWIASQLCLRNHDLRVCEWWPTPGTRPGDDAAHRLGALALLKRINDHWTMVASLPRYMRPSVTSSPFAILPHWPEILSRENPHPIVSAIETEGNLRSQLVGQSQTDTMVYRFLHRALALLATERSTWTVVNEYHREVSNSFQNGFLTSFEGLSDIRIEVDAGGSHDPERYRYWVGLRAGAPQFVVDTNGYFHSHVGVTDLHTELQRCGGSIPLLAATALKRFVL